MALFTPRGLKLRFSKEYAFGLMARLYPQTDAFRVLQRTEEIDHLSSMSAIIAALVSILLFDDPLMIGFIIGLTTILVGIIHVTGFLVTPITLLLPIAKIYNRITGYGIFIIGTLFYAWSVLSWDGVIALVSGRIFGGIVYSGLSNIWARNIFKQTEMVFTASERSFFHAYRFEAKKLNKSLSVDVSDEELLPEHWLETYFDLTDKWPAVTDRFTDN